MRNTIQIAMICITPFLMSESYGSAINQLPETPNNAFVQFQKALADSNWQKALECCSNKVRSKADEYGSSDLFFKDVSPIDEIIALSEFQASGRGHRNNEVVRYSCEIKLKDPNYRYSLNWNLSILNEDSDWVVEFPTKPLDIWVKHEILKMKVGNDGLRIEPEKSRAGFEVRLIPLSQDFVIGKPMLFRVEMKNISDETLGYTHTSFMVNNPMLVTDSNGIIIPYIDTSYQTLVAPEFVEPEETVVLTETYDVRSQYHIVKPGKYTFQFKGLYQTKPSNMVEIDIMPGQLSALESVVEGLMPILPNDWRLTRRKRRDITDSDSKEGNGIFVSMIGKRGNKVISGGTIGVFLLINPSQSYLEKSGHESELWGHSQWGPVYVKSLDPELLWANYKEEIMKALDIKEPK